MLTTQSLEAAARLVQPHFKPAGLNVIFTPDALEDTSVRLFPESRNRSARITKKLVKRHGGIFRKQPCMYRVNGTLYAHPALKARIAAFLQENAHG